MKKIIPHLDNKQTTRIHSSLKDSSKEIHLLVESDKGNGVTLSMPDGTKWPAYYHPDKKTGGDIVIYGKPWMPSFQNKKEWLPSKSFRYHFKLGTIGGKKFTPNILCPFPIIYNITTNNTLRDEITSFLIEHKIAAPKSKYLDKLIASNFQLLTAACYSFDSTEGQIFACQLINWLSLYSDFLDTLSKHGDLLVQVAFEPIVRVFNDQLINILKGAPYLSTISADKFLTPELNDEIHKKLHTHLSIQEIRTTTDPLETRLHKIHVELHENTLDETKRIALIAEAASIQSAIDVEKEVGSKRATERVNAILDTPEFNESIKVQLARFTPLESSFIRFKTGYQDYLTIQALACFEDRVTHTNPPSPRSAGIFPEGDLSSRLMEIERTNFVDNRTDFTYLTEGLRQYFGARNWASRNRTLNLVPGVDEHDEMSEYTSGIIAYFATALLNEGLGKQMYTLLREPWLMRLITAATHHIYRVNDLFSVGKKIFDGTTDSAVLVILLNDLAKKYTKVNTILFGTNKENPEDIKLRGLFIELIYKRLIPGGDLSLEEIQSVAAKKGLHRAHENLLVEAILPLNSAHIPKRLQSAFALTVEKTNAEMKSFKEMFIALPDSGLKIEDQKLCFKFAVRMARWISGNIAWSGATERYLAAFSKIPTLEPTH